MRLIYRLLLSVCLLATIRYSLGFAESGPAPKQMKARYRRPTTIPFPADNRLTPARVRLGKMLFFDPRLSASGTTSCATCHNPALSWTDGLARGLGDDKKVLPRRTPTILNLAWGENFFWDGRANTLEEQALGPIGNPNEMNMPLPQMLHSLHSLAAYKTMFAQAYPGAPLDEKLVAKAVATFERTVVSGKSPFDWWIEGKESAISPAAKHGFMLFNTKARCVKCHDGWRFTDDAFHDIGLADDDIGRGKLLPIIPAMQHAFKTPTLRNVALDAPYMHDGSEKTLSAVMDLYQAGGRVRRPSLSLDIRPLGLTDREKRDIIEFMRTLTSDQPAVTIPMLPR